MFERSSVPISSFIALGIVAMTSVLLLIFGRRYTRGFVTLYRAAPPLTWMFRKEPDPDLERTRRQALAVLPIYLIALVVYLLRL